MITQAFISTLFAFITSIGLLVPDENVIVTFETTARINQLHHGHSARALCIDGHVYLDESKVDLRTDLGRSILVHELVHYTQNHCPRDVKEIQAKNERIAYQVQNLYLERIGSATRVNTFDFSEILTDDKREAVKPYTIIHQRSNSLPKDKD